jgi:hypothetical protein
MNKPVKMELDGEKVNKILEALSNIKAKRWVATGDKMTDYGVGQPQWLLGFSGSGIPPFKLQIAEKESKIFAIDEDGLGFEKNSKSIIFELDRSILELLNQPLWKGPWLDFDKERVTHLEIAGPSLAVTFLRTGQDWSSDQSELAANSMRVNWYLSDLAGLEVARVVRYDAKDLAEFGLDKPTWRIHLKGLTVDKTLLVSEKGPGTDRYATIAGSNVVVVLDATQVARIVKDQSYFRGTGGE